MPYRDTQAVANSPSLQTLHKACAKICKRFGFQYFLLISKTPHHTQPRLTIIQGKDKNLPELIFERHGIIRVSTHAMDTGNEVDNLLRQIPNNYKHQFANILLSEQVNIPLINHVSFPVIGKEGDIGMLILSSSVNPSLSSPPGIQFSHVQEFTEKIHQSAMNLSQNRTSVAQHSLTPRELECLHWAAAGKTNWEIGVILGVSKRTIVFHLHNSAKKLETSNRYHTVARAVSLGLT